MTSSAFVRAARSVGRGIKTVFKGAHRALETVWLTPVLLYRRCFSPLKGRRCCRFTPSCSRYAVDAVREWGILIGTPMALWRVIRCNPFSRPRHDPVPTRREAAAKLRAIFSPKRAENGPPEEETESAPREGTHEPPFPLEK